MEELGPTWSHTRLGVVRAYATRHGARPLVTEDAALARGVPACHNAENPWQGALRLGWFDAVGTRYAIRAAGGLDGLVVTNLDRLDRFDAVKIGDTYRWHAAPTHRLPADAIGAGSPELLASTSRDDTPREIPLLRGDDWSARALLTAALSRCSPGYRSAPGWHQAMHDDGRTLSSQATSYLALMSSSEVLGTPVVMASWGPRSVDKTFL